MKDKADKGHEDMQLRSKEIRTPKLLMLIYCPS